jgi:hypothetical protein
MAFNRDDNLTAGVVAGAVTSGLMPWVGDWLSDRYSSKQVEQLNIIKDIYMIELGATSEPDIFILENGYPKAKYDDDSIFSVPQASANDNQTGAGNYGGNSKYFISAIEGYLKNHNKRFFGRGKKVDVIALVLIEWLNWASYELPLLNYDSASSGLLEKRKNYLSKICVSELFSRATFYRRALTRFDTFHKLQAILDGCIQICKQEEKKQSVRDYLGKCRKVFIKLLQDSVSIFYLTCDEQAHNDTFSPIHFIDHGINTYGKISNNQYQAYSRISLTENGRMLKDVINLTGLKTLLSPEWDVKSEDTSKISEYYDANGKSLSVNTGTQPVVFFPWHDDIVSARRNLTTWQAIGEALIDFSVKINIVNVSYDIVGGRGDNWVSQPAKKSFLDLLLIVDTSLQELIFKFAEYLKTENNRRNIYHKANRLKPNAGWKVNFYKMMTIIEEINQDGSLIHHLTVQIRNIINQYPVASQALAAQELTFFNMMRRLKGLDPLPKPEVTSTISESAPLTANTLQSFDIKLKEIKQLRLKIAANKKGMIHFSKPGLNKFKTDVLTATLDTRTSIQWANEFLTVHKHFFIKYNAILNKLMLAIAKKDFHYLGLLQIELTKSFSEILEKINQEKPQWRFKYSIIPVSAGWPFHRQGRQFANLLYQELATTFQNVSKFISKTTYELEAEEKIERLRENQSASLILLADSIKQTNYKALQTSHQLIARHIASEAGKKQNVSEFLAAVTEQKAEAAVSDDDNSIQSLIDNLVKWSNSAYEKYSAWMKSKYLTDIEFFTNESDTLASLLNVTEVLDELRIFDEKNAGSNLAETARDVLRTLCKQLDAVPVRVPEIDNRMGNLEQVGLMRDFLIICLEGNLSESGQLKSNFKENCKIIFNEKRNRAAQSPQQASEQPRQVR